MQKVECIGCHYFCRLNFRSLLTKNYYFWCVCSLVSEKGRNNDKKMYCLYCLDRQHPFPDVSRYYWLPSGLYLHTLSMDMPRDPVWAHSSQAVEVNAHFLCLRELFLCFYVIRDKRKYAALRPSVWIGASPGLLLILEAFLGKLKRDWMVYYTLYWFSNKPIYTEPKCV